MIRKRQPQRDLDAPPSSSGSPGFEGRVIQERYRLVERLGRGGMGVVWRAVHLGLDTEVAVKLIDDEGARSPSSLRRFRREARAAAALRSPHVVRVHDYGIDGDQPFLVMEMLQGEDLAQRLARSGPLVLGEAARIVRQLADALEATHDAGLVHRDVKPSNVFLAKEGHREVVKLLDFGVVKDVSAGHEQTESGLVVGSPRYMSPEQLRGGEVDHASDLWSLGTIVFEMLTGVALFEGRSLGDVCGKILTDPIVRIADVAPELPPGLDDVLASALQREPGLRCKPRDLAAAIDAIAEAHPDAVAPAPVMPLIEGAVGRVESTMTALDAPSQSPSDSLDDTLGAVDTTTRGSGERSTRRFARHGRWVAAAAGAALATYALARDTTVPAADKSLSRVSPALALAAVTSPADTATAASTATASPSASASPSSAASVEGTPPEVVRQSAPTRPPASPSKLEPPAAEPPVPATEPPVPATADADALEANAAEGDAVEIDPIFGIRREKRATAP